MKQLLLLLLSSLVLLTGLPAFAFDEDHKETINGTTLHFRVRGADKANPYLLILHGGPGFSAHMFYSWGPSLEKSLNVVYLDQRGCGESARLQIADEMNPKPAEIKDYTFANLSADIEGVRQFLKVDKWYVLGHSYGGMLGLEYVTAHPDHVRGYIHMDGLVSVPQMQSALLDNLQAKFDKDKTANAALLAQVAQLRALPPDNPIRLFGAFGLAMGPAGLYFAQDQKAAFPAFQQRIAEAVKPYNLPFTALLPAQEPGVALIAGDHFLTRDDTPLLAKVTVPTLIINGKQDGVIPPASAEAAHTAIKGSQLIEFDNCGHFPFYEQPEKTTAAILSFTTTDHSLVTGSLNGIRMPDRDEPEMVMGSFSEIQLPSKVDFNKLTAKAIVVFWTVNEQGRPEQISMTPPTSGNSGIDSAIINAIYKFRFLPARHNGKPEAVKIRHSFTLSQ